jgi:hypothetical protein
VWWTAETRPERTSECLEASRAADLAWDEYMLAARACWPYDDPELRRAFAAKEHAMDDAKEACGCG